MARTRRAVTRAERRSAVESEISANSKCRACATSKSAAPYMHDGSLATLEDVIDQYAAGGRGDATTDPLIKPFSLSSEEKADLLEFLRSFTDPALLQDPRFAP